MRRAAPQKADGDTQTSGSSVTAAGAAPTSAGTGDPAEPGPFQTILGDVLPQSELLASPDLAIGPGTSGGLHFPNRELSGVLNPAFEIGKQASPAGARTAPNQNGASGEVAFAARIAERTATPATLTETAIAASRFDATTGGNVEPQAALTSKNDTPNAPAKAAPDQPTQAPADDQPSFGPDTNRNNNAQSDADSPGSGPSLPHAASQAEAAAAALSSQNTISGAPAPTSLSASQPGLHDSAPGKAAQEGTPPQLLEPRGQATGAGSESVRDISLRLSNGEQGSVQVRFSERAGELQVSVRTPDTDLSRGLRDGLSDLVGRLQNNGYRTETWQPSRNGDFTGQERGQDAPAQGGSSHGRNSGGSGSGSGQQNPKEQQPEDQAPKWVRELESSLQRSNSVWPPSPTR